MEAVICIGKQGCLKSASQSLDKALPPFPFSCTQPCSGTGCHSTGTGTHSPWAAELMQNSSDKLINSNNFPHTQWNLHQHWWALHPTTHCPKSVPVTLPILILVHSLVQHYLEQKSWKLKTKKHFKSKQTSCVICLPLGDLNNLKSLRKLGPLSRYKTVDSCSEVTALSLFPYS